MTRKLNFGLNLAGFGPVLETVRLSRTAEKQGFEYVWIADENPSPLCRDVVVNVTAVAMKTSKIKIGTGICNFYTRHPALLAVFVSSIDEMATGRVALGVGPGGDMPLRPLGIKMWEKPLATVREGIEVVTRLLSGEKVDYEGEMIRTKGAKLAFLPKARIPIYLAARSPKFMQMIGEVADGSLLNTPLHYMKHAMRIVKEGAEKAGRNVRDVDIGNILPFAVGDSNEEAQKKVKYLATFMSAFTSDPVHEELGTKPERIKAIRENVGNGQIDKAASFMTSDMTDEFSVAGTPAYCLERIEEFFKAGVTQMIFVIPEGTTGIKSAGSRIIPSFATR